MKLAAVSAIANLISVDELHADYVIPDPFDCRVAAHVAAAVAKSAIESGVARRVIDTDALQRQILTSAEKDIQSVKI